MAAVDSEGCTADEVVASQHEYGIGHVLRLTNSIHQVKPGQAAGVVNAVFGVQWGLDDTGGDGGYTNIVLTEFGRQLLG